MQLDVELECDDPNITATRIKFVERATRLYEQERSRGLNAPRCLGEFVRHGVGWAKGGWQTQTGLSRSVWWTSCGSVSGFSRSHETQSHQAQTQQGWGWGLGSAHCDYHYSPGTDLRRRHRPVEAQTPLKILITGSRSANAPQTRVRGPRKRDTQWACQGRRSKG